jgi:hypothetical protein
MVLLCTAMTTAAGDAIRVQTRPEGDSVTLSGPGLAGMLLDNNANRERQGSGFNPLCSLRFPGKNIFRDDAVGLNFEHVFNGVAANRKKAMFTPRRDCCVLLPGTADSAALHWPAEDSWWGLDCKMTCSFAEPDAVDLCFEATPTKRRFGLGYAVLMWANYMNCALDRRIYFMGKGGWESFGNDTNGGFERGTVAACNGGTLPYEKGAQTLNLFEDPSKRFQLPFFYGLLDGDQDLAASDDTLAYIVMFDQCESIRFALWNFITDKTGKPDTHSPAWDWQFVIRAPRIGETYRYRARVLVIPFSGPDAVLDEYARWSKPIR